MVQALNLNNNNNNNNNKSRVMYYSFNHLAKIRGSLSNYSYRVCNSRICSSVYRTMTGKSVELAGVI